MSTVKVVFTGVGALLAVLILGFFLTGADFESYKFWAPKYENARRNVFVQTDSFVEGKISYLTTLELQYEQAETPASKGILRTTILTEAAQIDPEKLPAHLQGFINSLRSNF